MRSHTVTTTQSLALTGGAFRFRTGILGRNDTRDAGMTWTNAFDVGECEVAVEYIASGTVTELYREVMAKGGAATCGGGDQPGPYGIAVSASGEISISGDQFGGGGGGIALRVIPASVPADVPCRVRGITVDVGSYGSFAYAMSDVELSGSPETGWAPDPCDLPNAVEMSVYGEAMGI